MDDWDRGNLALCVKQPQCFACGTPFPVNVDSTYKVEDVSVAVIKDGFMILLLLEGVRTSDHHPDWVPAEYFRKLNPPEAEPCSEEFMLQLKNGGTGPVKVPDRELEDA